MNEMKTLIEEALPHCDKNTDETKLQRLASYIEKTPGLTKQPPFLEIGTRAGGSALLALRIVEKKYSGAMVLTVDPYGEKPVDNGYVYPIKYYSRMKHLLAPFENHIHYYMTSEEFLKIIDTIHYWNHGTEHDFSQLSFAYLDGSHEPATVKMEFETVFPRLINNGFIVVDNTDFYDGAVQEYFETLISQNVHMKIEFIEGQTIIKKCSNSW